MDKMDSKESNLSIEDKELLERIQMIQKRGAELAAPIIREMRESWLIDFEKNEVDESKPLKLDI